MPRRPCVVAGCPSFATYRGRCQDHARIPQRSKRNRKHYDSKRWRMTSRKKLTTDAMCQACGDRLATQVDHIIPIEEGGDPWAMDNLQSLCGRCHGRKTRSEQIDA